MPHAKALQGSRGLRELRVKFASDIVRLFYFHNDGIFAVSTPIDGQPATAGNGSTVGFACNSLEQVQALHDAGVANGGTSIEDPPGPRAGGMGTLNLCYVRDPSGNKICGLHRAG